MQVRRATFQDAQAISDLTAQIQQLHRTALPHLFKPPSDALFPAEKLERLLQRADATVAVAEDAGEVLGHVYFTVAERQDDAFRPGESYFYVHQIGVREDARRRGIGTALMTFVAEEAAKLGILSLQLDHWAFNSPARSFFERAGFAPMRVVMRRDIR